MTDELSTLRARVAELEGALSEMLTACEGMHSFKGGKIGDLLPWAHYIVLGNQNTPDAPDLVKYAKAVIAMKAALSTTGSGEYRAVRLGLLKRLIEQCAPVNGGDEYLRDNRDSRIALRELRAIVEGK